MLPGLPAADTEHRALRYPKQRRYLPLGSRRAADLADLFVREPRVPAGGPAPHALGVKPRAATVALRLPPLRHHVGAVLGVRPGPEVGGVHARRVIPVRAVVENLGGPGRDMTTEERPGDPVRGDAAPPAMAACNRESAVSVSGATSHPDPAFAGSVHFREKASQNVRVGGWERGRIVNSHGDLLQRFSGQAPVGARHASGVALYSTRRIQ